MKPRRDHVPAAATGLAALLAAAATAWPDPWIYERSLVLGGQGWRIFTAHAVHFGPLHLWTNLAVVLPAVYLGAREDGRTLALVLAASATAVGAGLFAFDPALARFGGLSGVACALVAWTGLRWCATARRRTAGVSLLAVLAAKLMLFDSRTTDTATLPADIVPLAAAHWIGAAAGGAVFILRYFREERLSPRPTTLRRDRS
ncbi:MAG: rhombosortase [Opitutales bacterium]|nr:rhombosortase [Opitutales bacterium]